MRHDKRKAFTLVELLVVLGILICLVGILLPALTQAREQGRRVQCLANLRSLTQGWLAYASDNEGHFCSSGGWVGAVEHYVPYDAAVYRCPDDPTLSKPMPGIVSNAFSYQANGMLAGSVGDPFTRKRLSDLSQPSKTFVFIEGLAEIGLSDAFITPLYPSRSFQTNSVPSSKPNNDGTPGPSTPTQSFIANCLPGENHHGRANTAAGTGISFADGHAIFWNYSDYRTGNLLVSVFTGMNNSGNTKAPVAGLDVNSSDVLQLEAWSGATLLPPDVAQ